MVTSVQDQVGQAADEVGSILEQTYKAKGATLGQRITSSKRDLPRSVLKSATEIDSIEKQRKYQPFLLESQKKSVEKARKNIADHSQQQDTKAKKKMGRKQWFASLFLNYAAFLVLLAGFWYVATQM